MRVRILWLPTCHLPCLYTGNHDNCENVMHSSLQIKDSLRAYRAKQIESRKLYDIVLAILCTPQRQHLLSGFQQFVAKPDRAWFGNCVR